MVPELQSSGGGTYQCIVITKCVLEHSDKGYREEMGVKRNLTLGCGGERMPPCFFAIQFFFANPK
jgi:hypothetical protein